MAEQPAVIVSLQFPLGADNLSSETRLPEGAARVLSNLDPLPNGVVRTRKGLRLVSSGRFRSLHRPTHRRFSLCWNEGSLCRIDGSTVTALVGVSGASIAFTDLNNETFWTDGHAVGRVKIDGASSFWGMPTPPTPIVNAIGSGGLAAGHYQVTRTVVVDGIESGAAEPASVEVSEGGGISIEAMGGATSRLYITPPNGGSRELHLATIALSGAGAVIGSGIAGKRLDSLFVTKPFPGQALAAYRGRIWVASGSTLWFTDALSPHWVRPEFGYFKSEHPILMLGAAENGLFVGMSTHVAFFAGADPQQMAIRHVSSVGVAGAAIKLAVDSFGGEQSLVGEQCAWVDRDGYLCVGRADGSVYRPHRSRYCMGTLSSPALAESKRDGIRQVVIGASSRNASVMPVTDATVVNVFTHGVVLGNV